MMTEEAARKQFNLKNYIIQATIGALIMGVVTSAIVAIFTRKREKPS
jgi:subtilase family serine protease